MKLTDLVVGEEYALDRKIGVKHKVVYTGQTERVPVSRYSWEKRTVTQPVVRYAEPSFKQEPFSVPVRRLEPWADYQVVKEAADARVAERDALFDAINDQLNRLGLPLNVHSSFTGYTLYPTVGLPAVLEALKQLERNS